MGTFSALRWKKAAVLLARRIAPPCWNPAVLLALFGISRGAQTLSRILPNFFLLGTAKAGTTSLWSTLKKHPDIYFPDRLWEKEPSYFCGSYGINSLADYVRIYSAAEGFRIIGDASHAYLTSPESCELIKRFCPSARFLVVLRNPIGRAYSLFQWMRHHGYEPIETFEDAIAAEPSRIEEVDFYSSNGQYYYNFLYLHSGLYYRQVLRYYRTFGPESVLVVSFDDLCSQPDVILQRICDFLEVPYYQWLSIDRLNVGHSRINPTALPQELNEQLVQFFAHDVARVSDLVGLDLCKAWPEFKRS